MEPWVLIWQQSLTEQQRWFKLSRLDGLIKNGSRINWPVCLCKTVCSQIDKALGQLGSVCVCWGWWCCLLVSGLCCRIIQRLSLSHPPSIAADQLGVKSGWIICAAAALIKQQLMDWPATRTEAAVTTKHGVKFTTITAHSFTIS